MKPNRDSVLGWVTREVPPAIQRDLGRLDTCVLGTRVGYDVCSYFGVEVKPVVVRTMAMNQKWIEFAEAHPELLDSPNDDKWLTAPDAWAIAIDETDRNEKGRFAGHLVLYAPGDPARVLDLSVQQFQRLDHDMIFPAGLNVEAPEGFLDGEPLVFCSEEGGANIVYGVRRGVKTYTRGGDWSKSNHFSGALIRRARDELTSTTAVA